MSKPRFSKTHYEHTAALVYLMHQHNPIQHQGCIGVFQATLGRIYANDNPRFSWMLYEHNCATGEGISPEVMEDVLTAYKGGN